MDTYQGTCKYCGAVQPIMAVSQEAADEEMSNTCDCRGAEMEQKQIMLMQQISYIAQGDYDDAFLPLSEMVVKMLKQAGKDIVQGYCDQAEFVVRDSKIKIWNNGEKYKISRIGTRKEVAEV